MDNLKELLTKKEHELQAILTQIVINKGAFYVSVKTNLKTPQFFLHQKNSKIGGKYIKDSAQLSAYLQEEYNRKLYRTAKKMIGPLQGLNRIYTDESLQNVYLNIHPAKRPFIVPLVTDRASYIKEWEEASYDVCSYPATNTYTTTNGESVRSKSELYIANQLAHHHVPYRYEAKLNLGHSTVYPDFTVLNPRTLEVFYWEHFGMMDDPDYCRDALRKQHSYITAGILPGKQLLCTMESGAFPLSTEDVNALIAAFLL